MTHPTIPPGFRRFPRRRGVTIIVVLGLISIALALSYAVMRAQGTALQVSGNSSRRLDARQAAISGINAALRKMHQADWAGVDSVFSGQLSPTERYSVTFTTGDPRLTPSHAEYADWPYRVTLVSTGTSADPGNPAVTASHRVRAIVRLNPRKLSDAPPDWSHMQGYTVYQYSEGDFTLDLPCRVEGRVWLQGRAKVCETYPNDTSAREQYLNDLRRMKLAGHPDYRPLEGPLSWRSSKSSGSTRYDLESLLGIKLEVIASRTASNWSVPQTASYRLYPGGKQYQIATAPEIVENATLGPDPQTNPLGIYWRSGRVELRQNARIQGMLITGDDVFITGAGVEVQSLDLPALANESSPVRLQALMAADDLRVWDAGEATITGAVAAWDEFEVREGPERRRFSVAGRVITRAFFIRPRTEWQYDSWVWDALHDWFRLQADTPPTGTPYFPEYVARLGRSPQPRITVKPDSTPQREHWYQPSLPLYIPHQSDPGLRWEVIDWSDSPAD